VVYLRVADMVKRSMGETVPLRDRITMQSASMEVNRVLCLLASKAAGFHIEEIMQARSRGVLASTKSLGLPTTWIQCGCTLWTRLQHQFHVLTKVFAASHASVVCMFGADGPQRRCGCTQRTLLTELDLGTQVVDLGGVNTYSMLKHQRSPENQAEWQHNADFNPETLVRCLSTSYITYITATFRGVLCQHSSTCRRQTAFSRPRLRLVPPK